MPIGVGGTSHNVTAAASSPQSATALAAIAAAAHEKAAIAAEAATAAANAAAAVQQQQMEESESPSAVDDASFDVWGGPLLGAPEDAGQSAWHQHEALAMRLAASSPFEPPSSHLAGSQSFAARPTTRLGAAIASQGSPSGPARHVRPPRFSTPRLSATGAALPGSASAAILSRPPRVRYEGPGQ